MKLTAALKHRRAFNAEIGFCRTKFAPMVNACWVVVLPFTMAKVTEFLLLTLLRRPSRSLQSALQVIAIDYDGVKLFGAQNFLARAHPVADFDLNGQLFQGGLNHADDFGIPAEQQRLQGHRKFMVTFLSGQGIVTEAIAPVEGQAASQKPGTGN